MRSSPLSSDYKARSKPNTPRILNKNNSKNPENFGKGEPEGLIASETANNATVGGGFVPTLCLGIPGTPPDAVILGDIYKDFNWQKLNTAFEFLSKKECILIALHKNRYCRRENKIALDLGPFVSALEFASSKKSLVIGKPEKKFFDLSLDSLGFKKKETLMIGDDIISDVGGAKSYGIKAIQVKTGKYQSKDESDEFIQPDLRINSIADLLFL